MRMCSISTLFDACSFHAAAGDARLVGCDDDAAAPAASAAPVASQPPEAALSSAATPPETVRLAV